MKNQDKLKGMGLNGKERYYYLKYGVGAVDREDGFLGRACVCLLPVPACGGNTILRGISFCNPLDLGRFSRKKARDIALGRAIKALENGDSSEYVPMKTPAAIMYHQSNISLLSEFNPELTYFEKRLVND